MNVYHKPTENFMAFVRWHYARGQGLPTFQDRVGKMNNFIKLRIWSSLNIIKAYYRDWKFPLILFLLVTSIFIQKYASWKENINFKKRMKLNEIQTESTNLDS